MNIEDLKCCGNCVHNIQNTHCLEHRKYVNARFVCNKWEYDEYNILERKRDAE